MKYIKQMSIIMAVCLVGEWLSLTIPITIPASIMAMILMYGLLESRLVKEHQIAETTDLMLQLMPLFIIPSSVTVINYLAIVQAVWFQLIIICLIGVLVTFLCAYGTTKWLMAIMYADEQEEKV